jgi:hypothetical protein
MNASWFLPFAANDWNVSVRACDTLGLCSQRSARFHVNDTILPICSFIDLDGDTEHPVEIDATCYDEALFSLNVTCTNGYIFGLQPILETTYHFREDVNFSQDADCTFRVCDAHTDRNISGKYKQKRITNGFLFEAGGAVHRFTSKDASAVSIKEKKDRVSPTYSFTHKAGKVERRRFYYSAPSDSVYLQSPLYRGWIVSPSSGVWFDAETDDPGAVVEVSMVNGSYVIDIWTDRENLTFSSIGLVNCYEDTFHVAIDQGSLDIFGTYSCPVDLSGMLLFIFLIGLDIAGCATGIGISLAGGGLWGMILTFIGGFGMLFLGFVMMGCFAVFGWIMLAGAVLVLGIGMFAKV